MASVFSKNRDRLIEGDIAEAFLQEVLKAADARALLSHEQLSRGECSNATHQSVTDPDARLTRKSQGTASILGHLGSVLMDNRHGLIVATDVRAPSYTAEREAAVELLTRLEPRARRRTLGADKGYDAPDFVADVLACGVTPHVAQNLHAKQTTSAIGRRTTRHAGYAIRQIKRKLVEDGFGWGKTIGGLRQLRHRGHPKVAWSFAFTNAAYHLVRLRTLLRAGVAVWRARRCPSVD